MQKNIVLSIKVERRIKMKKHDDFDEYLAEQMKNPEFKAEYDALEPEFAALKAQIEARRKTNRTQLLDFLPADEPLAASQ